MTLEKSRVNGRFNLPTASQMAVAVNGTPPTPRSAKISTLRVSVVIPARNEAENLPWVLDKIPPWVHEIILVDGLSVDDTIGVAKMSCPQIRIVHQTGKGKGNALREGFASATGDIIVSLDADGSMDPGEMNRFVELIDIGFDYVRGSRMLTGGSSDDLTKLRRFGNWFFRTLTNGMTGSRYTDLCYGYFAVRRDAIEKMDLRADGFEIETEMNIRAHRAGLRTGEVPSSEYPRQYGTSQLSTFRDGMRILLTILKTSLSRQPRITSEQDTQHHVTNGLRANPAQVHVALDGDQQDGNF